VSSDPPAEGIGVVEVRERLVLWRLHAQELAQRLPALFHLVNQQPLSRDMLHYLLVEPVEYLDRVLAILEPYRQTSPPRRGR
jgi:hypothetical protein